MVILYLCGKKDETVVEEDETVGEEDSQEMCAGVGPGGRWVGFTRSRIRLIKTSLGIHGLLSRVPAI